jgi:hypothetical protein
VVLARDHLVPVRRLPADDQPDVRRRPAHVERDHVLVTELRAEPA